MLIHTVTLQSQCGHSFKILNHGILFYEVSFKECKLWMDWVVRSEFSSGMRWVRSMERGILIGDIKTVGLRRLDEK